MSALSAVPFRDGTTGLRDGCSTSSSPDLLCDCHPVNVPAEIFRTYDIRGIVGRTLTPAIVRPVRIAIDCGKGVGGMIAPAVSGGVGWGVEELYCGVEGRFPTPHPDPWVPKNVAELIEKVRKGRGELGIAFDGEGDRLGLVTK